MSSGFHCGWLSFLLINSILFLAGEICSAQSTVVHLPGHGGGSVGSTVNDSLVPNSLTAPVLHAESMLDSPTPDAWRGEMFIGHLVKLMNRGGFSVVLQESASDNNLHEESLIRLALHNASIDVNLRFALKAYSCDFRIVDSGVIEIHSDDGGSENLSRVTYDIGRLASDWEDAEMLTDLVQESIDTDSWESNGGNGRLNPHGASDGFLLTVVTSWSNHREVRKLLADTLAMGGGPMANGYSVTGASGVSQSVKLPEEYLALRRNRRGMSLPGSGTTSGFGGGGRSSGGIF